MKKIISCLLVCMLLLTATAFAAESADVFVSIGNPKCSYNGETLLDAPSAWIDLDTFVTDTGLAGMYAKLRKGEKMVALAKLFVDENGLTFTADGLEDMYTYDVKAETGVDLYDTLKALPLFTEITGTDYAALFSANEELKLEDILAGMTDNGDGTYTFTIDKEMFRSIVAQFGDSLDMDEDEYVEGTITVTPSTGNNCTAEGVFTLYDDGGVDGTVNFTFENTDGNGSFALINSEDSTDRIVGTFTTDADGNFNLDVQAETIDAVEPLMTFAIERGVASDGYTLRIIDDDDEAINVRVVVGDSGFAVTMDIKEDNTTNTVEFSWVGEPISDTATVGTQGTASIFGNIDGESFEFSADVQFGYSTLDSAQWYNEDTSGAIDIENISEEQMGKLSAEGMGILGRVTSSFSEVISALMGTNAA